MQSMTQTLLLDAAMRPIRTVPWTKAMTLIVQGKAELVEAYAGLVHSVKAIWKMPAVVKLVQAVQRFSKPIRFSRQNVFCRDRFICQFCGKQFPPSELTIDHVIPKTQGGRSMWINVVASCYTDNQRKGGRTPAQAGMRLLKKPDRPTWIPLTVKLLKERTTPAAWDAWI